MKIKSKSKKQEPKRIAKKRPVRVKLVPTPFSDGEVSDRGLVKLLYLWLLQTAPKHDGVLILEDMIAIPDHLFARILDIHRCCVYEWDAGLRSGYFALNLQPPTTKLDHIVLRLPWPEEEEYLRSHKLILKSVDYDPWVNRKWDKHFVQPWFPYHIDEIVDKYYSVFRDEEILMGNGRRHRPDDSTFVPLTDNRHPDDHPMEWKNARKHYQKNGCPKPPPESRRSEIEKLCTKEPGRQGKGAKKAFESWIAIKFGPRRSEPAKEVHGHITRKRNKAGTGSFDHDDDGSSTKAIRKPGRVRRRFS